MEGPDLTSEAHHYASALRLARERLHLSAGGVITVVTMTMD
jgi:hypothetical protein